MIVNSIFGPLNCNEYDSAFEATDAKAPVAGRADGLIHASTDTAAVGDRAAFDTTCTRELVPEKVAALSLALASRPGAPSVTPEYVPALAAPDVFAAVVPDVSSRRQ